ncbi:DUF2309 domain-containing protein [Nitrospina watsonii]|uniref:Probable inorganic carbon transporter subunit DabA n=1 Tax=Nitrospina watsonii TaxID=1323948 RepID=A0ABM9HBH2_9BACT|nr:DUF2309 domain-containing protein [Nitrospina watsonii]CAI2717557.1 conserved protein of unknown function [Nitrospina watsonii]
MNRLDVKELVPTSELQRMELRSLVNLAGETISYFWPMKMFIHHNPLHGLEHLPFEEAINEGKRVFGGRGYLCNEEYRNYYKEGRISEQSVEQALVEMSQDAVLTLEDRKLHHREVLKTILIHGTGKVAPDVSAAVLQSSLKQPDVRSLLKRVQELSKKNAQNDSLNGYSSQDQKELGIRYTLGEWCDQTLGTKVQDEINGELIKWCGGFLDEGHASWDMPLRKKTFYGGWKKLVRDELSGSLLGIQDWKNKIESLSDQPEEAVLESLSILGLPKDLWSNYFTLLLAQMSGWTGFIKWRSDQSDYEWQRAFPIDLVQYMAVRLFYEREIVALACRERLAIPGTYPAIQSCLSDHPRGYGLFKEYQTRGLPDEIEDQLNRSLFVQNPLSIEDLDRCDPGLILKCERIKQQQEAEVQTLVVLHLARTLAIPIKDFLQSPPETLGALLEWVEQFPEAQHGPVWLQAFESSYLKDFMKQISPNLKIPGKGDASRDDVSEEEASESRPLAQAVFCIDVRSESFRRHLEGVGGNETFGFAGFFGVPICYQGYASEQQTDQCPVLLKPKHVVREIPRAYQAKDAEKFLERQQLAKTGHTLLEDLKENVITPYVMVEAIGWFYGFKLFVQTLQPKWFKTVMSGIKARLTIPINTTLTVDKISGEEAQEMVAAQYGAAIYRQLIKEYGRKGAAVPHEQIERLRKLALQQNQSAQNDYSELFRLLRWTESDLERFIRVLRKDFDINERDAAHRMHRITQTGFTPTEQAHFVETALRIMGFTKTFARLVLLCAHGSTSDNNPYESALDCGACGGNHGISNARTLAVMANKPQVRQMLAEKGLLIPPDTHFLPGQHDTTTDEVELFDLEDVPATHRKDLRQLQQDLKAAGENNSRERLTRLPDEPVRKGNFKASARTKQRSIDWSQVRPEWGLSRHTAFIAGRRSLTQGINLEGRSFLHSYDYSQDPSGKYLEIIMTAPMIVGNWINMEHYFSTVDPDVYGSGSKAYHNVVGHLGVMFGTQSDLCVGLPIQTVYNGEKPYHEPMRLFVILEAPLKRITDIIERHEFLQELMRNQWLHLVALDPDTMEFFRFQSPKDWEPIH